MARLSLLTIWYCSIVDKLLSNDQETTKRGCYKGTACKQQQMIVVCLMWEPRRLKALLASTACYKDSFTSSTYYFILSESVSIKKLK
jgi:hypothetical protein